MDPLSLKVLASLLQLHGGDATIASDNKGIDQLLGDVRQLLDTESTPPIIKADYNKAAPHHEVMYAKTYEKWISAQPPTTGPTAPLPPSGSTNLLKQGPSTGPTAPISPKGSTK